MAWRRCNAGLALLALLALVVAASALRQRGEWQCGADTARPASAVRDSSECSGVKWMSECAVSGIGISVVCVRADAASGLE